MQYDEVTKIDIFKNFSSDIALIKFHPLISIENIKNILENDNYKGIIIECYGIGNLPSNIDELESLIRNATKK